MKKIPVNAPVTSYSKRDGSILGTPAYDATISLEPNDDKTFTLTLEIPSKKVNHSIKLTDNQVFNMIEKLNRGESVDINDI